MTINFIRLDTKTAGRVLVLLAYLLFVAVFILPLSTAQAADSSNMNKSPEEIVQQMKERLRLTEEQVAKIRPIIDESFNKCRDILDNNGQDKKSNRSALQEVRWKTDMKLGQILTEQQMSDYQNFFEEKSEKSQQDDMHHGKGGRSEGGMRAF